MTPDYRVVVQASERDAATRALKSAKNLIAGLEAAEVEVVGYAGGVEELRIDGSNVALMDLLAGAGVRFVVCEHTLRSRSLSESDFPGYVEFVPSGVVELVVRQADGWCYIRP